LTLATLGSESRRIIQKENRHSLGSWHPQKAFSQRIKKGENGCMCALASALTA
jgi:hypothetical protein